MPAKTLLDYFPKSGKQAPVSKRSSCEGTQNEEHCDSSQKSQELNEENDVEDYFRKTLGCSSSDKVVLTDVVDEGLDGGLMIGDIFQYNDENDESKDEGLESGGQIEKQNGSSIDDIAEETIITNVPAILTSQTGTGLNRGKDLTMKRAPPSLQGKRQRPFSAEQIRSNKRRVSVDGRKTVGYTPSATSEELKPVTPNKGIGLLRRSPRTAANMMSRKRMYDSMKTSLSDLELLFGSKFPTLKLTVSKKISSDDTMESTRKSIRHWCFEIKNPDKSLCRPAIDITYIEPPCSIDGLTSISILVCHPDEVTSGSVLALDVLCTLAKGGLLLSSDFVDLYNDPDKPMPFPPVITQCGDNQLKGCCSMSGTPMKQTPKGSEILGDLFHSPLSFSLTPDTLKDINVSKSAHLPGEHPVFPSIMTRHPKLSGSNRLLLEGMKISLAGDFGPPNPPFAVLKTVLKCLGVQKILREIDYKQADLIVCAPNFKDTGNFCGTLEIGSEEDEMKFLLFWRRLNIDGCVENELDDKNVKFRLPRSLLFSDYTPIRTSKETPFRSILSSDISSSLQSMTAVGRFTAESEVINQKSNGEGRSARTSISQGDNILSTSRGKIFVKISWLMHSLISWQLEVPHLFTPMWLKSRKNLRS